MSFTKSLWQAYVWGEKKIPDFKLRNPQTNKINQPKKPHLLMPDTMETDFHIKSKLNKTLLGHDIGKVAN